MAVLAAATLGYGYWHYATHGYVSIALVDAGFAPVPDAEVALLDARAVALARARATPPYHTLAIVEPAAYDCRASETGAAFSDVARAEWTRCFERQSRWMATWARRVTFAEVWAGGCELRRVPVTLGESHDAWWLWWVPLRHVGGPSYQSFGVTIRFDPARCAADGSARR